MSKNRKLNLVYLYNGILWSLNYSNAVICLLENKECWVKIEYYVKSNSKARGTMAQYLCILSQCMHTVYFNTENKIPEEL